VLGEGTTFSVFLPINAAAVAQGFREPSE
jgi:hypothetical protein